MPPELHTSFVVVYFLYGLAFFGMGLAMLLEAGRSPLLAEARILRPLAAFGVLHGLHEWLEIFILQGQWFGFTLPLYLLIIRLVLLAVSFASLLAYGIQVLRPPTRLAAMDAVVGAGMVALYLLLISLTGNAPWDTTDSCWIQCSDVLARYVLAVPGALLAALALRYQANQARKLKKKKLAQSFHGAAIGFAVYGVSQILVSKAALFPAQYLNAQLFRELTGIPIQVIRACMAGFATVCLIRATQIVDRQRNEELLTAQRDRLEALERVQEEQEKRKQISREFLRHTVLAQEEERARIARELHDETAQTLTAASLNMATLQSYLEEQPEASELIKRSQALCRQMSQALYRMVHDLRPAQLDDLGLVPALHYLIDEGRLDTAMQFSLKVSGKQQRLDPLIETVLFRIAQEALTNVSRHAKTDHATVQLLFEPEQVILQIRDQGIGFNPDELHQSDSGFGLAGMRERTESVNGRFKVRSAPGKGTMIEVIISLPKTSTSTPDAPAKEPDHG